MNPVSEQEILNVVSKFQNKKSCGYDNISMYIVKKTIMSIVKPLSYICNRSFETGIFPDNMKKAKVIPLFKAGDRKQFSNYRPVSMLPQFSKVLERVFNNRLTSFIKYSDVLYNGQYGFRNNHSTSLALMELIEEISTGLDNNLSTTGVFIDLQKAFDTIDHSILISKLQHYGIRGLPCTWLESYLSNRTQFVKFNGAISDEMMIRCGVPQGSILGPALFILYINDIANVSVKLKFILFADDTNIFYTGKGVKNVNDVINKELRLLNVWFKVNKLSLNVKKTNFMVFSNENAVEYDKICINGMELERVCVTKFLGIMIDHRLTWTEQIKITRQKISKSLSILYKVKDILDTHSLLTLYNTLILPYLNYASEIWGNTYQSQLACVSLLQKKAIRIVAKANYQDHTTELFYKFQCLKFIDIIHFKKLVIMYKAKYSLLPINIQKYFYPSHTIHKYNTRSGQRGNFALQLCRTKSKSFCISVDGVKLWNALSKELHNIMSLCLFKKQVKKELMKNYCQ